MVKYKRRMDAIYTTPCLPEYAGNPFIEALPPLLEPTELYKKLYSPINYNDDERKYSKSKRLQILNRLKHFFIPNNLHVELYNKLYMALTSGYEEKNPFNPENVRKKFNIRRKYFNYDVDISDFYVDEDISDNEGTTSNGLCIFGTSGVGKTVSTNKILSLFPQFIHHTEYKGNSLIDNQIVYIKIECPTDGTIKSLCNAFFNKLDEIIDNAQYFKNFGGDRRGTMVQNMPNAAINENIGLIVIDEIQHLARTKIKAEELLDFLVEIINTIQVPILVIGTNKAYGLLQNNLRGPRRIGGSGFISWDRIVDKSEWRTFMTALWQYQWTQEKVPLSDKLIDLFYEHSQGIIDFAVKLFTFTQANAIYNGHEKIDSHTINETAKKDLALTKKMREAIKSGDKDLMGLYEDILIPNMEDKLNVLARLSEKEEILKQTFVLDRMVLEQRKEELYLELLNRMQKMALGDSDLLKKTLHEVLNAVDMTKSSTEIEQDAQRLFMEKFRDKIINEKQKPQKIKNISSYKKDDLRSVIGKSKKENKDVYTILHELGYIKSPKEFIK
ncbi:ATP-binding protein [Clostridium estertheticum]|uniref:ATP-binding protein n=1 Tax=Clostridium estertheticum TaxID=238834 RepID=UPI001C0B4AF2|nr:ATP-binding protein [Clostridium estertheticum]MBU3199500.1 ATP-binding protein [Clostridium estertheticum]WAG65422.1 ATP-binding protein [Clostridium estertheticum]